MKYTVLWLMFLVVANSLPAQHADFEWAMSCGNPPNTTDTKTVLAHGPGGDFYLAGEFIDTASFGDHSIISAGGTDIGLVKHDSQGIVEWAMRIGASDDDYIQRIHVGDNGNILLAGYFYGSTVIGGDSYTSFGSQDVFVAMFNGEGDFLWSRRFGGIMADYVASADLDESGNVLVTGYFYGEMAFGDTLLQSSASCDIYLAKFNPAGELDWVISGGGSSSDQVKSMSCSPEGDAFITCSFYSDFTIGDTTLTTTDPVGGLVAEISSEGLLSQVVQLHGTYLSPDVFVKAGNDGSFYLAGCFSGDIYFGNTTFSAGEFNQDLFIVKYGSDGGLLWANNASSRSSDQVMGIDTDPYGNLYLTGHYLDTIAFGQLILPYKLCCGSREIFIVNYNSIGKVQWGKQITGPRASIQSLSMHESGTLMLSGMFTDTLAFDAIDLSNLSGYRTYLTSMEVDMATGVGSITSSQENISIYPNPAGNHIRISGTGFEGKKYSIYNSTGARIQQGSIEEMPLVIDISAWPGGLYFVEVFEPGSDHIRTGKVLIH